MKFLYFLVGCTLLFSRAGAQQWSGKTNVFVGDSYTEGYGLSTPADRFSSVLTSLKGSVEDNRGYGGRVLESGQSGCGNDIANFSLIPTKTASHLFLYIALGLNDIGFTNGTFTPNGYQTSLTAMVDNAISKGWPAGNIVLITPFWVTTNGFQSYLRCPGTNQLADIARQEAYAKAVRTVAAQKNTVLADIYTAVRDTPNNRILLHPDELHYNKEGNKFIADFLANLSYVAVTLPLTLKSFSLKQVGGSAHLQWISMNEVNTREFVIERSSDEVSFETIGRVEARGTSAAEFMYQFIDVLPMAGNNIYRLKMIDQDGRYQYSKLVTSFSKQGTFTVYPNPANGNIAVFKHDSEPAWLQIIDISGRVVQLLQLKDKRTNVSIQNFKKGVYLLKVVEPTKTHIQKLLVE